MTVLAQAAPAGLFDNEGLHEYLQRAFTMLGRTNDFRQLRRSLYIVAADVESTEAVCFGAPGFDHVPISRAIQASMSSPGIYVPVTIDGRFYVDGTLRKGLHASVAFEDGADLVFAVNPQVPIDASAAVRAGTMAPGELTRSGMPNLLSQMFRTMVYSRMQSGIAQYARDYPDKDILLFEPTRDDAKLFFSNVFSFQSRRMVCEHAYQMTRRDLLTRADELEPSWRSMVFACAGIASKMSNGPSARAFMVRCYRFTWRRGARKKAQKGRLATGLDNVSELFSKAL